MTSDPFSILIRHNHWANGVLLERCAKLSAEQFHHKFPIGLESLHDTIDHIIGCTESWVARVRGEPRKDRHNLQTMAELHSRLDASTAAVTELASQHALAGMIDRQVTVTFPASKGGTLDVTFTAGAAIVHCLVHGTHHRAQALNMLRQLNLADPLPELDVMDWQYEAENTKAII